MMGIKGAMSARMDWGQRVLVNCSVMHATILASHLLCHTLHSNYCHAGKQIK
jgi:hypothetical protein